MSVSKIPAILYSLTAVAALLVCGLNVYYGLPRTIVITRTPVGFSPTQVLIKKSDTVRFVNDSKKPLVIESDRFASSLLYPEAKVTVPIEPGSSWSFTFADAGVWAFRDAARPELKGEILIHGASGEATRNCLRKAGPSLSAFCWGPEIRSIIDAQGLDAAFNYFASTYTTDSVFRQNCHDITHILGVSAYESFRGNASIINRQETSYCGYGFYHGFIQAAIGTEGPEGMRVARSYCQTLETSDKFISKNAAYLAGSACYHGIGHSVFDLMDESIWGNAEAMAAKSITTCETALPDEHARRMCASGVYNSLAIALSARTYKLSFDDPDIFSTCRSARPAYSDDCYGEVGLGYAREHSLSTKDAIDFFKTFGNASGTVASIGGIIDDDIRRSISTFDPETYRKLCASFSNQLYADACLFGVSVGLSFEAQVSHDYSHMISFCEKIPAGQNRKTCFAQMFARIRGIAAEKDMPRICGTLAREDQRAANCPNLDTSPSS